ncbi:MAG: zinc ribbon domain-containing protein, partial [Anaerolineaceae bacterium]|nr:zinc ribbon domain-containing protein [Anaerolineaceae bacterium]
MEVPRHWRIKHQRYAMAGEVCTHCGVKLFPPRPICPHCRAGMEQGFSLSETGEVVNVPAMQREAAVSYRKAGG